ncbi:TPA: methionine synthase [Haemophilus influenzae]|uniref:Uncharacterized protein n=2 Tax=Haemophilus influenzae TaxID=727 RepID=A0A0H3PC81_HAEI3|nr:hypothetical protein [Haemophilus influenzae]AWP56196.1 methionine synthase [Haemophilus influenzae]EDJ92291.1 hypothetical protein CGSHi3655_01492 [Haemophilus influenzae 3655]EDK07249.1 hypothetical protein CGSHiAA_03701 [Haemophilus influenzae PittAA]EEP47284.1 hypothetical protein CGSHi6P18H1_02699 [Haemophilus influenzae 6P18H1]KOR00783.1 methionine synthase [Haemophilus influenzae]
MVTSGNYASYYLVLLPSENGETIDNWVLPLGTQGLTFEADSWNSLSMRSNVSCFMRMTDMPLDRSWRVAWNSPLITVCHGNWSKDESVLLRGSYTSLVDLFESALPDILMLEFSTPSAGELSSLLESEILRQKCILGLGVINPRSDEVETVAQIVQCAEKALNYLPPEQISKFQTKKLPH